MEIRHLTGIFIRAKVDDKFGSFDISDLPWEVVEKWLTNRDVDEEKRNVFIASCLDKLVENLVNLLNFIDDNSDYNTVESVRKNLFGEPIQQCRQCLATLNMLADVYRISKVPEENS